MPDDKYDKLEIVAAKVVRWATGSHTLLFLMILLVTWIVLGPVLKFSPDWQSSMTLPATAITFLLVFLILRAQNKDTRAIQLKLNEIIGALHGANNELIDIENMSEKTLEEVHKRYEAVAVAVKSDDIAVGQTESIHSSKVAEVVTIVEAEKENVERDHAALEGSESPLPQPS